MELTTAIEILEYYQEWRLGKRDDMIHEPKKLTEALDVVLFNIKAMLKNEKDNKNLKELIAETFTSLRKNYEN